MKTTTKLLCTLVICLSLLPIVFGLSKPIAGIIESSPGIPVDIYVQTNSENQEICKVAPSLTTAEDGSFASDLSNLVLANFPTVRCSGLWQAQDTIWYTAQGKTSPTSTIELGTQLQYLPAMPTPTTEVPTSESGSSGGGTGGGPTNNGQAPVLTKPSNTISLLLEAIARDQSVEATIQIQSTTPQQGQLRVVLLDVNNLLVAQAEKTITFAQSHSENLIIPINELTPNYYNVQALYFSENKLQAASQSIRLFLNPQKPVDQVPTKPAPYVQAPNQQLPKAAQNMLFTYALSFVLILIATLLFLKKIRNKKSPPDLFVKDS